MEDCYIFYILILFIGIIIISGVLITTNEQETIYECIDYKGDLIYCKSAYTDYGRMFGIMEDGTKIVITSYKSILEEERNK